tara:strand:- start:167 stop:376 length:210 start_codon:yes stop_codon:yes gene_type:complete
MSIFEIIGPSVEDNDKAKEIIERKSLEAAEKLAAKKARELDDALDAVCGDGTAATLRSLDGVKKVIASD